ncbi:MAG: ABC transporter ATP-binding protein [Pseudomonadota bacterium]
MTDLLTVDDLHVTFRTPAGLVKAVDGVSFSIDKGEIVAIVGESGSGKSVTARAIMGLVPQPPGKVGPGRILFDGDDLLPMDDEALRQIRGRRISMIFQEPMTSLNPVIGIGRQMTEAMRLHLGLSKAEATARAVELLRMVGISEPARRMKQYPHHLSGGMRQRVMIAMALACEPELIIADEPTTALDVTIQAQILTIMQDLCTRLGVALVIITHNLGIVARYASRVNVMYAGRIVEQGPAEALYRDPRHPYTAGLLNSVPRLDRSRDDPLEPIPGNPPDLLRPPTGCAFAPRCGFRTEVCDDKPGLADDNAGHAAACWNSAALARGRAA